MTDKHLAPPLASPSDQRYANIRRHRGAGDPGLLTDSEGWLVPLLLVSMLEGNVYGGQFESRVEALGFSLPRPGMMYQTLRTMERDGMVIRTLYPTIPPRVEYELSALGRSVLALMEGIKRWSEEHAVEIVVARDAYDVRIARDPEPIQTT